MPGRSGTRAVQVAENGVKIKSIDTILMLTQGETPGNVVT